MHPTEDKMHDLREGATLCMGWLETVFRHWDRLSDQERREMVAAALFGANEIAAAIERLDGKEPREIQLPQERMANEFLRLIDGTG